MAAFSFAFVCSLSGLLALGTDHLGASGGGRISTATAILVFYVPVVYESYCPRCARREFTANRG